MISRPGDMISAEGWNRIWARRVSGGITGYIRDRAGFTREIDATLAALIDRAAAGRSVDILELGCAPGTTLLTLHKLRPQLRYHGVDIAVGGLARARSALRAAGVRATLRLGDMRDVIIGPFDIVISCGLIEHFEQPGLALQHHVRLAKPGGSVVVTVPNYSHSLVVAALRRFSPETLVTHNLKIMSENALFVAMIEAGLIDVVVGAATGPLLPGSHAVPTFGGAVYRAFARGWNLRAGMLPRKVLWAGMLWACGRR